MRYPCRFAARSLLARGLAPAVVAVAAASLVRVSPAAADPAALNCDPGLKYGLESTALLGGRPPLSSLLPAFETTWTGGLMGNDAVQVSVDHRSGDLWAGLDGTQSYQVSLTARDRYEILGVPEGTPLSVTVELHVRLSGCCSYPFFWPWIHASLGGDVPFHEVTATSVAFEQTLLATVDLGALRVLDPIFFLEGGNGAGYGGAALLEGHWRFTGLPAGASVTSCKEFQGEVVPTRPASWGAVKALYR